MFQISWNPVELKRPPTCSYSIYVIKQCVKVSLNTLMKSNWFIKRDEIVTKLTLTSIITCGVIKDMNSNWVLHLLLEINWRIVIIVITAARFSIGDCRNVRLEDGGLFSTSSLGWPSITGFTVYLCYFLGKRGKDMWRLIHIFRFYAVDYEVFLRRVNDVCSALQLLQSIAWVTTCSQCEWWATTALRR